MQHCMLRRYLAMLLIRWCCCIIVCAVRWQLCITGFKKRKRVLRRFKLKAWSYSFTYYCQLCEIMHPQTVRKLPSLPVSCADAQTPTHSNLCSLRQPGLPAEDSYGLSWTSAIHIPPSPGCRWFIWAQPVHSVTPYVCAYMCMCVCFSVCPDCAMLREIAKHLRGTELYLDKSIRTCRTVLVCKAASLNKSQQIHDSMTKKRKETIFCKSLVKVQTSTRLKCCGKFFRKNVRLIMSYRKQLLQIFHCKRWLH